MTDTGDKAESTMASEAGSSQAPPSEAPPPYPGANSYTEQGAYGVQAGYQQGGYPQSGYPPQGGYPQAPYPTQGAYPSYPPQGYEPPKGSYPPPSGNYMPPHTTSPNAQNVQVAYAVQPQTVVVATGYNYGMFPVNITCPKCNNAITTEVSYDNGAAVFLFSGLCCLFGCWLGCCLIPFCMKSMKDVRHTCPNCNAFLGKYSRM